MPFSTSEDVLSEIPVLRIAGEVDISAAEPLRERIDALIDRGSRLVVLDLSEVSFLDSSGLKVLDEAQRAATARGSRLALACPPGRVLRLFEITGLDDLFTIHPDARRAAADDAGGTDRPR